MMANINHKDLNVSQTNSQINTVIKDDNYETPPKSINKENNEDDVFYSINKSKYKLRSTPMRTLHYNGSTPLRESRITCSKKKRKRRSKQVLVNEEMAFDIKQISALLPTESETMTHILTNNNKSEAMIQTQQNVKIDGMQTKNAVNDNNDLYECNNDIHLTVEVINKVSTIGRASHVIESRVHQTVKQLSPVKSAKAVDSAKRFVNLICKKGTPIRPPNMEGRVRSLSISSSLYSSVKNNSGIKYKSTAQLIKEFETNIRDYDISGFVQRNTSDQRSRSFSISSLTCPISPKLHAFHTIRHRYNSSQIEKEKMIAQEIKKYAFKANPIRFDARFASGIPRVKSSEATKAIEMNFLTEKRSSLQVVDKEMTRFRVNPLPAFKNPLHVFHPKSDKKVTAFKS